MTLEEAKKEIENWMYSCGDAYSIDHNSKEKAVGDALSDVLGLLNEIEPELSRNPGQLTLAELAREMRKIFRFKYLVYGEEFRWGQVHNQLIIGDSPFHLEIIDEGGEGCPCLIHEWFGDGLAYIFDATEYLVPNLDLSEYADENGVIDYSKCIVEVEG